MIAACAASTLAAPSVGPTSPSASATGFQRWLRPALPSTIGTSGGTHGDRIVRPPAAKASMGLGAGATV